MSPEQRPSREKNPIARIQYEITERIAKIEVLNGQNIFRAHVETYLGWRDALLDVYRREIEALRSLDPATCTQEDIEAINHEYGELHDKATPQEVLEKIKLEP